MKKILFSVVVVAMLWSCGKDDGPTPPSETENSVPVIASKTFTVAETISDTEVIGKVMATDADDYALTFSIATNSDALFEITAAGDLSLASGKTLDAATKEQHAITVKVDDGEDSASATITIKVTSEEVTPTNEAPVMANQEFTVIQTITAADEIGQVAVTDPEGDDLTFNMVANDNDLFDITEKGILSLAEGKSLDFESATEHVITIGASDGNTTTQATITVHVLENDPDNQSPVMEDQEFTVSESITDADEIGQVVAIDPEENDLTFSMVENDNDLFAISDTGMLTLAEGKNLDYQAQSEHSITVGVSDGNTTVEATITILVEELQPNFADDPASFVTKWKTTSNSEEISFKLSQAYEYDFIVDWGDGSIDNIGNYPENGLVVHSYDMPGTHIVAIKGQLSKFAVGDDSVLKLIAIERWGGIQWKELSNAFKGCENMVYNASDVPNLSNVNSLAGMFSGATKFDGDLSAWDTGNVTIMSSMFEGAILFNGDISTWNVSNVTTMFAMFRGASSFNSNIADWITSSVTNMRSMFTGASSFNRAIGNWDISKVTNMQNMLDNCGMIPIIYGVTLQLWAQDANVPSNITLGAAGLQVDCDNDPMKTARNYLINTEGWTINDTPCP